MPQPASVCVCGCACVCLCVAYFLCFFICATADRHRRAGREYLSEADLCCLEAQHFKPSLSCAHKYQNSSLCYHPVLPPPPHASPASTTFTPLGSDWRIMQIYLAIAVALLLLPVYLPICPSAPPCPLRRVEAAKLHWIIAWAVCLFQATLIGWYFADVI